MNAKRLLPVLCLGMLLLLPGWTLMLWLLQEHMVVVVGGAALGVALLLISTYPSVHVPGRGRAGDADCPACGYDLTGNRSGICPECGRPLDAGRCAAVTGRETPDPPRNSQG